MLRGAEADLSERETALADWSRRVVADPNATTEADTQRLRDVGLNDREIFEATTLIAFRLAFSTVNDALGARPDAQLAEKAPEAGPGGGHVRPPGLSERVPPPGRASTGRPRGQRARTRAEIIIW